ncbi:MAG: hypothetical protein HXX20_19140 [Chloroflexi bacterium]|nr:hypothetical protein [Chloroflexota bacterium]
MNIEATLALFTSLFPEQGLKETRSITTSGYPGLLDDCYGLFEAYCTDPKCNCRRVMLNVVSLYHPERYNTQYLASISYGFDRKEEMAGPFLDELNPQSPLAKALLSMVEELVLSDPAYIARLEAHYKQVKQSSRPLRSGANYGSNPLKQFGNQRVTGKKPKKKR